MIQGSLYHSVSLNIPFWAQPTVMFHAARSYKASARAESASSPSEGQLSPAYMVHIQQRLDNYIYIVTNNPQKDGKATLTIL